MVKGKLDDGVRRVEKRIKVNQSTVRWLTLACVLFTFAFVFDVLRVNVIGGFGVVSCLIIISGLNTALRLDALNIELLERKF